MLVSVFGPAVGVPIHIFKTEKLKAQKVSIVLACCSWHQTKMHKMRKRQRKTLKKLHGE